MKRLFNNLKAFSLRCTLKRIGVDVFYFDELASTNVYAKENVATFSNDAAIIARIQTAGRGRKDRSFSSKGGGLYLTLVLGTVKLSVADMTKVVLAAGVSVAEALQKFGVSAKLKWPNDVIVNGKKICGIISETVEVNGERKTIIGIGINVTNDLSDVPLIATSLKEQTGKNFCVFSVANSVIRAVVDRFRSCEKEGFDSTFEAYRKRSLTIGASVLVLEESGSWSGIAKNVDSDGFLLVDDGINLKRIVAADVSVRHQEGV